MIYYIQAKVDEIMDTFLRKLSQAWNWLNCTRQGGLLQLAIGMIAMLFIVNIIMA